MANGSGWNLWVWLLGVVLRRYIDFLILLIPTPLVYICTFFQQHPYFFFHFVKMILRSLYIYRGGVEGPAGTANAVPLFTVVRIAVPLFKAGRTGAANVPPRMRDCSARAYSTYAWASTVKLILTKAIV